MAALMMIVGAVIATIGLLLTYWAWWRDIDRDYEEDLGWHRMWHERIMEDEDHGNS